MSLYNVDAEVITGTITDWPESGLVMAIGDGVNDVHAWWSISSSDEGWFYGSGFTGNSDVAHAVGVTDVRQITDASIYSYTDEVIGPFCDADCDPDSVGEFIVWRNINGYYGVLRIDDIVVQDIDAPEATLSGTWWFQTDGTPDFSAVSVGGSVTGLSPRRVLCENLTTGQGVLILLENETSWDCATAGLEVNPGDEILQVVLSTANAFSSTVLQGFGLEEGVSKPTALRFSEHRSTNVLSRSPHLVKGVKRWPPVN